MDGQLWGILTALVFYGLFFGVGCYAARAKTTGSKIDELLLAGRNLPLTLGVLTMVATWVGGGYLNGTAEALADPQRGLVWAQAPWGFALSLILGGLFFAGQMRRRGFRTLLDLFSERYQDRVTAGLFIPALLGDIFWSSAILAALGATFATILNVDITLAILLSAAVAIGYTVVGGLRSVAYTDALQLFLILAGLTIAIPFSVSVSGGTEQILSRYTEQFHDSVMLFPGREAWIGPTLWGWQWLDLGLLLIFGGIPWQVYFQRVLACRSERNAVYLSIVAGFGCLIVAFPAALIGVIGAAADWTHFQVAPPSPEAILPYVLKYLTPPLVANLGLAAVAAAVMSSVDSSILSASSMFAWNIYRPLRRQEPTDQSITRVTRITIVCVGAAATALALQVQSVYTLWLLSADLVYAVLFPQLIMALYDRRSNSSGACAGALVSLFLRIGGGEPSLGLEPLLSYPMFEADDGVLFPFRTFSMLSGLITIGIVSRLSRRFSSDG